MFKAYNILIVLLFCLKLKNNMLFDSQNKLEKMLLKLSNVFKANVILLFCLKMKNNMILES